MLHETPQERGVKRKTGSKLKRVEAKLEEESKLPSKVINNQDPVQALKEKLSSQAEKKEKVSPILPLKSSSSNEPESLSKLPNQKEPSLASLSVTNKVSSELGPTIEDVGPEADDIADMPRHQEQSELSSQEVGQLPCPNLTDGDEKVSPTSPSKLSNQDQPKSLSSKETCQPPCPPLTDESNDEKVSPTSPSKLSNEEQPKSPKTRSRSRVRAKVRRHVRRGKDSSSGITSSSEDEGGEEALIRSKRKKLVRRARAKTPTLTSDSEEEKSKNEKLLKNTMRGGGAGGSNYYFWLKLAEQIMEGVRRAQLPLRLPLDDITEGDGNCYFRAVCSQCQRPEVALPDWIRRLDHRSLRRRVCRFMLKTSLTVVKNFRRNWYEFHLGDYNQWWADMAASRGNIWAEGPVIHATAWFLERDIYVVSEQSNMVDPFIPFSGNQDGSDIACAGAALWLGHLTGLHYQTLMPTRSESVPSRPKLRDVEETLRTKAKASSAEDDHQTTEPGPSKKSRVEEVS